LKKGERKGKGKEMKERSGNKIEGREWDAEVKKFGKIDAYAGDTDATAV